MTTAAGGRLPVGMNGRALIRLEDRPRWMLRAACSDTDTRVFFPDGRGVAAREATAVAKAVCRGCPVRLECLAWAIARGESYGILGGATERDRRVIRRLLEVVRAGREAA